MIRVKNKVICHYFKTLLEYTISEKRRFKYLGPTPYYVSRRDKINKELVTIDPNSVQKHVPGRIRKAMQPFGYAYDGRWDKTCRDFSDRYKVRSIKAHFEDGVPWKETEYFKNRSNKIEENGSWRGCQTSQELVKYLRTLDELYEQLATEGYMSQKELLNERPEETKARQNDGDSVIENEIRVAINRNDQYVWMGYGQHRLAISQLLGLNKVCVWVIAIHTKSSYY